MQLHKLLKTSGKCGQGAKFQGKLKRKHTHTHKHVYVQRMHVQPVVRLMLEENLLTLPLRKRRILWSLAEQFGCIREVRAEGARQAKLKANGAMQSRETPTILLIKNAIRAKSEKCKVRTQQRQTLCRVGALLYTLDCTAMFD